MMNIVALCLVVTSLATAGVLSPTPSPTTTNRDEKKINHQVKEEEEESLLVSKEGLRVIVVEYEKQGTTGTGTGTGTATGKTKISISPPQEEDPHDSTVEKNRIHNVELNEDGTRISDDEYNKGGRNARQVICDAFGKCNNKIVGAFSKGKEKVEEEVKDAAGAVSRKAHEMKEGHDEACDKARKTLKTAIDTGKTLEGDVRRNVSEDLDIVRRHVANKAKEGLETAETAAEKVKDKAKEGLETAETAAVKVKDKARGGLETTAEKAKEGLETAEAAAKKVKDKARGGLETAGEKAKEGLESAETAAEKVKETAETEAKKVENRINKTYHVIGDLTYYVVSVVSSLIGSLFGVVHLLGFAMAYGMSVWITFVSSYVLATALPRQQFSMVQSKIYPLYFRAMAYSLGVALLGHLLSQRANAFQISKAEILQCYNLIASLLMVFANLLYLEPEATKVMFERMKVEKEEGRGGGSDASSLRSGGREESTGSGRTTEQEQEAARAERIVGVLNERLKKLNSFSSTLNILTLMSLTWHLVYLGQRLHMSSCQ